MAFGTCGGVHHACSAANAQHSLWHLWQHAAHGNEAVLILLNLPALTANPRQYSSLHMRPSSRQPGGMAPWH